VILQLRRLKFCFINRHCFVVALDIGDVAYDVVLGVNWRVSYE
jgi:hypothetical protein